MFPDVFDPGYVWNVSFNKINSAKKIQTILKSLKNGCAIAVVSDAGMPGICDPGENIVSKVKSERICVICIPGACAAITALVSSGMPSSKFIFEGFLPKKKVEREKILLEISKCEKTTIIYESPHKLIKASLSISSKYCSSTGENGPPFFPPVKT